MVFIVHLNIMRQGIHENLLPIIVWHFAVKVKMPFSYSPGIGINHKDRLLKCVKKDGISCFTSCSFNCEQLFPLQNPDYLYKSRFHLTKRKKCVV